MADGPVQLVLNPERFSNRRLPAAGGGPGKDFFRGHDVLFAEHRDALVATLRSILDESSDQPMVSILVKLRPDALAKSHRPFGRIFPSRLAGHVGTAGYGELILLSDAARLAEVVRRMEEAEIAVGNRVDATGAEVYAPTQARCETGAIESIQVWNAANERGFTVEQGEDWLASGGQLVVELLHLVGLSPRLARQAFALSSSLEQRASRHPLLRIAPGVQRRVVESLESAREPIGVYWMPGEVGRAIDEVESSPIVRRVHLEDKIDFQTVNQTEVQDPYQLASARERTERLSRPRAVVGVLDGGAIGPIRSMLVDQSPFVAAKHQSQMTADHASLVGSLLLMGSGLNPSLLDEAEDCDVVDITIFPDPVNVHIYYDSLESLIEQIRAEVLRARDSRRVKVFNLSWNLRRPPGFPDYGLAARALDDLALELDVIFVISAGNLADSDSRPEWPLRELDVLTMLAGDSSPIGLLSPAESIANMSVGAVNPPNLAPPIEGAPTSYSRRSLVTPSVRKPNFAAFGGAGATRRLEPTGLRAMNGSGNVVEVHGTSFAAPIFARYLATLANEIEGGASNELLFALAVHHAKLPTVLASPRLREIASTFVGFGLVPSVRDTLEGEPHRLTLVLDDVIQPGKRIELPFTWPESLVASDGRCRGKVKLTLSTRPILNHAHGAEMVRVNLDASLRQSTGDGKFATRTEPMHQFFSGYKYAHERTLATTLGKWFPIKSYEARMPRGRGLSPDWRLEVDYLTRAGEAYPEHGIHFSLILTIEDIDGVAPVFDEMRRSLAATGVRVNDLRTAVQVRT